MHCNKISRLGLMAVFVFVSVCAVAQVPGDVRLRGTLSDYTPASVSGPWEVRGQWSLQLRGMSGTADFSAALTMGRSDLGVMLNGGGNLNSPSARTAHTHHVIVSNGIVTPLANGFRVTGAATITGNGNFPPPFGGSSTLQIDVTGGNSVTLSNIKLTFGGDAATHFGTNPISGVVRTSK